MFPRVRRPSRFAPFVAQGDSGPRAVPPREGGRSQRGEGPVGYTDPNE
ncbi:MAG: hypothetical protein V1918_03940 [Planctomycetota bacterium]